MSRPNRPNMTGQRREAFDMLVQGESTTDVAAALGVSDRTVRRWRAEPAFAEALAAAGHDALEGARAVLRASAAELAEVLCEVAFDVRAPHAARVRAVEAALDRIGVEVDHPGPGGKWSLEKSPPMGTPSAGSGGDKDAAANRMAREAENGGH